MVTAATKPQGQLGEIIPVDDADMLAKLKRLDVLKGNKKKINDGLRPIKDEIEGIGVWMNEEFPEAKFTKGEKYRIGPYLLEANTSNGGHVEFDRSPRFRVKITTPT